MKFKGLIIGPASGRLGGMVFSHNRGGQYIRNGTIPITPPTGPQSAQRARMTSLVNAWSFTLTDEQRIGWNDYASRNPVTNGFGDAVNVGGLGMYVRTNSNRLLAGLTTNAEAPITDGPADITAPTVESLSDASPGVANVEFNATDGWNTTDGGALLVFVSRAQSPTRYSAAGVPLQFAGVILGDTGTPLTSPQAVTLPFHYGAGAKAFFRFIAVDSAGRVSSATRDFQVSA